MSKYPPPVANLSIFDPNDFNTTLNNGTPLSGINTTIETQSINSAAITTTVGQLFATNTGGTIIYNLSSSKTQGSAAVANTSTSIGQLPGVVNQNMAAGTYLVTCQLSVVPSANLPITYATLIFTGPGISYLTPAPCSVAYFGGNAVGAFDIGGSFIITLETNANINGSLYVGSTIAGSYRINTNNANGYIMNAIKLK